MHRIDSINARNNQNGIGKNGFHDNADLSGQDATYLTPEWFNAQQEEIANVIEAEGIALNKDDNNQLLSALNKRTSVLAQAIWHVGSRHMTGSTGYNPATALEPFFGYETTWYLWPYVPVGVVNTSAALGQITGLTSGGGTLAAATRIWERLPDGANPPSYNLTASQTTVNEGEQIIFTLSTNGIAAGTPVDWAILPIPNVGIDSSDITPSAMNGSFVVGSDGEATYQITIKNDNKTEGTEVLQFLLSAFPVQSVSITINDSSVQLEQIVHISSDSSDVNLLNLFTMQYGAPTQTTKAVFIIDSNVTVKASSTAIAAIRSDAWPNGSTQEIRVSSNAKVIGFGGDGGNPRSDIDGKDGGDAINGIGSSITVNNYGLIAGGGGGGAGYDDGGGQRYGGGGGAPLGAGAKPSIGGNAGDYDGYDADSTTGGVGGTNQFGHAGNGGDIGYDGQAATGSAPVGLAGFIYQGSVTINNLSGGETKGRNP